MALTCGVSFTLGSSTRLQFSPNRTSACSFQGFVSAGMVEEIYQNQVLTSAVIAGVTAQMMKPLSSALEGKGFNWRLIIRSGGMPSAHAATVAAAATALGLERGLSDSLFGFSAVMAGIIMYDAQGVRRQVGKQAEVINTLVLTYVSKANSDVNSKRPTVESPVETPVKAGAGAVKTLEVDKNNTSTIALSNVRGPFARTRKFFQTAETLPSMKDGEVSIQEIGSEDGWRHIPLKESVGHTKLQVLVGALFGTAVTILWHSLVHG